MEGSANKGNTYLNVTSVYGVMIALLYVQSKPAEVWVVAEGSVQADGLANEISDVVEDIDPDLERLRVGTDSACFQRCVESYGFYFEVGAPNDLADLMAVAELRRTLPTVTDIHMRVAVAKAMMGHRYPGIGDVEGTA